MKLRNTIWFKVNVLYLAALAVTLILYSALLYYGYYNFFHRQLDLELQNKATHVTNMLGSYMNILGDDALSFEFAATDIVNNSGRHPHENKVQPFKELWMKQKK